MIRSLQKSLSHVALNTALCPRHRKWINIEPKARTSQKSFCKSHSPVILAAAVLFHLDVVSCCQKPNISWAFNFPIFLEISLGHFYHFSTTCYFSLMFRPPWNVPWGVTRPGIMFPLEIQGQVIFLRVRCLIACKYHKCCCILPAVTSGVPCGSAFHGR